MRSLPELRDWIIGARLQLLEDVPAAIRARGEDPSVLPALINDRVAVLWTREGGLNARAFDSLPLQRWLSWDRAVHPEGAVVRPLGVNGKELMPCLN